MSITDALTDILRRLSKLERDVSRQKTYDVPDPGCYAWVPTLNTGDADLSGYTKARYSIFGKRVFIDFRAANKNVTGSAGTIKISLPIPVGANASGSFLYAVTYPGATAYIVVRCEVSAAGTVMTLYKGITTETGVYILISGFYEID